MFFIFGFGKETIKTRWEEHETTCTRCGNTRKWPLKKITRWFTLFFIPIIPYGTRFIKICPICGHYEEITEEHFNHASENNSIDGISEKITATPAERIRDKQLTEVQRRFKEEMASYEAKKEKNSDRESDS